MVYLSGLTTLVRVRFTGVAGTRSAGVSDTGSVKVVGAGSDTFGLFPFPSGVAGKGPCLATPGLTFRNDICCWLFPWLKVV